MHTDNMKVKQFFAADNYNHAVSATNSGPSAQTIEPSMQFISHRNFYTAVSVAFFLCAGHALAQGARTAVFDRQAFENGLADLVRATAPASSAAADAVRAHANQTGEVYRSRQVILDFSVLQKLRADIAVNQPQTMRITFFEDTSLVLQFTRTEPIGINGTAYIGTVAGIAFSSAVLVEENGVVSGNVNVLGDKYQIRNFGGTGHVIRQIDPAALAPDHVIPPASGPVDSRPVRVNASAPTVAAINTAADDGSLIDVLVVYTPAARISQGGTAAIKSLINLGITETNNAYANSQVTQRVRLVYAGELNYAEVDLLTDRDRLQGATDGFMDEVHELRNLYGADLVSLWGNYPILSGCGQSYVMVNESVSFEAQGFNVVNRSCDVNNYSFAHELGHNMGLLHDIADAPSGTTVTPENSTTPLAINYAHGYIDVANQFYTVMAITPCNNCVRIPYFSNPNVRFNAAPIGDASVAHDSRALNDTRETTANFRASVNLTGPGTVIFSPSTYTVNEGAGSVTLSMTRHAGANGAATISYSTVMGTALAGIDFTAKTGVLSWVSGESGTKTITVPLLQDRVLEGPKAFTVTLGAPTGGVSIGVPGGVTTNATVNVIDADTDSFPGGCAAPLTGWFNPPSGISTGWVVTTDSFFGPACSLKTNPTADSGKAQIQFEGTFTAGTISFARRVSSQIGNDCLRFFIDGAAQDIGGTCAGGVGASGEVAWGLSSFAITAGTHTLVWSYEKDSAGSAGADAAWIDSVVLPLAGTPVFQSGLPPAGFLNVPYSHTFVATGAPPIQYAASLFLPPGVALNTTTGVISGTPTALGTFTGKIKAIGPMLPLAEQIFDITIVGAAPGAPVIDAAIAGNGQASILFTPPASIGSAPITSYSATCHPNAGTGNSASSPIAVSGLVNGVEYTCSVAASNAYGSSASSAVLLVTPAVTRPGPPTIGTATAGNAQAFISFTPPGADGGSPITGYTASCNPGTLITSVARSPVNITNLINGIAYTCSITADNALGASVNSASISVTPSASAVLTLVGVASRKTHGASGAFDLPIEIAPPTPLLVSVEPRSPGSGHTIVFHFNYAINATGTITVVDNNNAPVVASSMPASSDIVVTIPTLANNKRVTVSLNGVNGTVSVFSVSLGFLLGDVNNSRSIDATDISGVRARSGQATTAVNFRFDVNASGAVNASDISTVKAHAGLVLP